MTGVISDEDEFALIQAIKKMDPKIYVPQNILDLKNKKVLHKGKIQATKDEIEKTISLFMSK